MKIKIKVKNLIIIVLFSLFLILVVTPLISLEIAIYLNNNDSVKAEAFFNNYMNSPIKINSKRGLYEYAGSLIKGYEKYKIKFSGWGGGENTSPSNMRKAMELFEDILLKDKKRDYKDKYSTQSYIKLLDTSIATLDIEKLNYWIDWGKDKENEEIKYNSKLYEAYYYFVQRDYKISKEILENLDKEKGDVKYHQLMGDINFKLGNIERAKEYYETLDEEPNWKYRNYFGGSNSFLDQYDREGYIEKSQGDHRIKGKVSYNGKGLPFVEVYLNQDIGVFRASGETPDAITDKNGEFQTLPLKNGIYEIGIGIHPSQLHDRVFLKKDINYIELNSDMEFNFDFVTPMEISSSEKNIVIDDQKDIHISWDEVKEADYYQIKSLAFTDQKEKSGGMYQVTLKNKNGEEKLKNNSMELNIESLNKMIGALFFEGEEEMVNPTAIFGSFIPNIEYPIAVDAYDKEDNLISSSLTLISDYEDLISIRVDEELTNGEKLILDKEYESAISYYEDKLIENPKDKEALFYLARFYGIGWKKGEKDIPKAFKYAKIYDKEYKDYNLSFEIVDFISNTERKDNKELVKEALERTPEKDRDSDYYHRKGMYYLAEGDFVKAREIYNKATRDRSVNILYIDMYLENYEKAISALKDGNISLLKMDTIKMIESLNNIETISKEDRDLLGDLLKIKLDNDLTMNEEKNLYNKTLNLIDSFLLKDIIKEIGKEEYWDR